MFKQLIALLALVFLLGWLSHTFYAELALVQAEPVSDVVHAEAQMAPAAPVKTAERAAEPQSEPEFIAGRERPSPADRLKLENVRVTSNRVVIDGILGYQFETAIFTNTNSMDNLLDEESQAIQIRPKSEKDIKIGDVISYDSGTYGIIIHRVIQIGYDEKGWYAIVKGDNNPAPDPVKVRFSMIRRVLVGVLY